MLRRTFLGSIAALGAAMGIRPSHATGPTAAVSLNFTSADTPPDVKPGNLASVILTTERDGKHFTFPAYYLNRYPLEYDDCKCETDKDHDMGCPTTGWFYDESNFDYDNCYHHVEGRPVAWALIPKSKDVLAALRG
jgi:hypothetical protein